MEMVVIVKSALVAALALASTASAAERSPKPASFAFNWLSPAATCKALSAKELAKWSKCEVNTGAFGLQLQSHSCKVSSRVEWMVYRTAAECREALETMQANGP
jgi:hypothetical protein